MHGLNHRNITSKLEESLFKPYIEQSKPYMILEYDTMNHLKLKFYILYKENHILYKVWKPEA